MSTFALVLQLWFTLSKALAPPKAKQRDCLRDGFVSDLCRPSSDGRSDSKESHIAPDSPVRRVARRNHYHLGGELHFMVVSPSTWSQFLDVQIGTVHPNDVERAGHFVYCTISTGKP